MSDKATKSEIKKHYLSGKESREIAKKNKAFVKELEKRKKRKNVDSKEYTTEMKDPRNIVEFDNLHTYFFTDAGISKAVNGVSFAIPENSVVGIVGESGCGKSVTSLSLMQLIQGPAGQIVKGEIRFKASEFKKDENGKPIPVYKTITDENGNVVVETAPVLDKNGNPVFDKDGNFKTVPVQDRDEAGVLKYETEEKVYDIAKMPLKEMSKIRGRQIAMIFQEPMTSLNPVFTIGNQLDEVTLLHIKDADKQEAKRRSLEMLELVGIAMPERVYKSYPHEISGGMRQRVMIAMALACNPRLVIADEPTTALDVTVQAQILALLRRLNRERGISMLLISHNLQVVRRICSRVAVMQRGHIVEEGAPEQLFTAPQHPYTAELINAIPRRVRRG